MRVVDDRIDDLPSRLGLSAHSRRSEHEVVSAWDAAVSCCYAGQKVPRTVMDACRLSAAKELLEAFSECLERIRPPRVLWGRFFRAMHWDLDHDRFDTWHEFLEYSEGASVAPTTIYLHLIVAKSGATGGIVPEAFDIMECGRHLGRFAYLGHIVRDLAVDLRQGDRGLIYVPSGEMSSFGVTEEMLFSDLHRGRASRETRLLVAELVARARAELELGRSMMSCLRGKIEEDREFILALVVSLYERVIDKIERCASDVMGEALRLTSAGKESLLLELARQMGADVGLELRVE